MVKNFEKRHVAQRNLFDAQIARKGQRWQRQTKTPGGNAAHMTGSLSISGSRSRRLPRLSTVFYGISLSAVRRLRFGHRFIKRISFPSISTILANMNVRFCARSKTRHSPSNSTRMKAKLSNLPQNLLVSTTGPVVSALPILRMSKSRI